MVLYRRDKVPGGTYFFTVTLKNRQLSLLVDHIHLLGQCFRRVKAEHPFHTVAIVVLPEHMHVIWQLSHNDDDYSIRWKKIKCYFTKGLSRGGVDLTRNEFGEARVWQRRFWEHRIRHEQDLINHVSYIHSNPVKHGLVAHVIDWPYSSFMRYVGMGVLPKDWTGDDGANISLLDHLELD